MLRCVTLIKTICLHLTCTLQKKQKTDPSEFVENQPEPHSLTQHSPTANHDPDAESIAPSETHSVDQLECEAESICSNDPVSILSREEVDVPNIQNENILLRWLDDGANKLKQIIDQIKSSHNTVTNANERGQYFSTKPIGAKPGARTLRRHNAEHKRNRAQHGNGLTNWLKPKKIPELAVESDSDDVEITHTNFAADAPSPVENQEPMPTQRVPVTMEEVDDEDLFIPRRTLDLSVDHLLEEDGLGDVPDEVFYGLGTAACDEPRTSVDESSQSVSSAEPESLSTQVHVGPKPHRPRSIPKADAVDKCIHRLDEMLHPRRNANRGFKKSPITDSTLRLCLELMLSFMRLFKSHECHCRHWLLCADLIATSVGKGPWMSKMLRVWVMDFVDNEKNLPTAKYGKSNACMLEDEDLAQELHLHLQSIGKYVAARHVVQFVNSSEVRTRLRLKKSITERTARRWMNRMRFRWRKDSKGMYFDGHERDDVVDYRQNVFLPRWEKLAHHTRHYDIEGKEDTRVFIVGPDGRATVIWRHDESTFYANDRRNLRWVHDDEAAAIKPKGEGISAMYAQFVSPDYGWLKGKDHGPGVERKTAAVVFKAGKNRDGYFQNSDIIKQATIAMDILDEDYPNENHVFAYDNAKTHTARAPDALSAKKMPLKENANFGYYTEGSVRKQMRDGKFPNGRPQKLYNANGKFKGMRAIIQERRQKGADLPDPTKLKAQCTGFKCAPGATQCCCHRILFNEPDFVSQKSNLEEHCEKRGYQVIFFPKYHCELNFIEMCWGFAKRIYREFPDSTKEADLIVNMVRALESIPVELMRKFARRADRFMDAYRKGLTGHQAAWAAKKY
jgi:hypothetical protein